MRRHQDRAEAGNCGCCLLPFVILLIAFVALVAVTSLVWHTTAPDVFGWEPAHHHFDAYRAGFHEGNRIGEEYAAQDRPEPSAADLDDLGRREAEDLRIRRDRRRWMEGFRDGFKRGFERAGKETSSSSSAKPPALADCLAPVSQSNLTSAYTGCGTMRIYGFGAFQPSG